MIEARPLVAAEKLELLQLLYRRLPNGDRLKRSTNALLHLFADCCSSRHWSVKRIAETLGYSPRTIVRAMAELRSAGVVFSVRKRRQTAERFICLEKARELTALAVVSIKETCAAAVARLRAGLEETRRSSSNHRFRKLGVTEAVSHLKTALVSDLTPSLRRLMLGG